MRSLSWRSQGRESSPQSSTGELETCRAGKRLHPETAVPRSIRHITLSAVAALALLAVLAPVALAANYHDAIRDCNDDGVLEGHYSRSTLRQAHNHLPSSLQEYSDCSDVLARALAATPKNGTGGGGTAPTLGDPRLTTGSGAIANNPTQLSDLKKQASRSTDDRAPAKVSVGNTAVTPGTAGLVHTAARTSSPNELPKSLLVALIALAAMGALAGLMVLRQRWPETRRVALRLLRR
jgi:hypothetical protein